MQDYAPSEFDAIGLDASRFKKVGSEEWHGPCPRCEGVDRFVIFTDREYPSWNWWCRVCHPESTWIDELNPDLKKRLTPEEKRRWAEENAKRREESLRREIGRAQKALGELQEARAWERYHQQLTDEARQLWESWGVPPFFQEFWKLGYDPDHVIWTGKIEWRTPTMTIPIFAPRTWECLNVRHRLLRPPRPGDKYRPETSGLPATLFVADPDEPVQGKTLLVEGEKKAMVSFITADDPFLQVVGIPGKNVQATLLTELRDCEPIYICLDPDARLDSWKLAEQLGHERCRIIELPDKIDDLVLRHELDKCWFKAVVRQAVKV